MDIRWEQRFSNFLRAIYKLQESVEYINKTIEIDEVVDSENVLDELIKEGLIQRFEYTHELAWNVMKDYAEFQGNSTIGGSRDASREALQLKIITDGEIWMDMIKSRNKTSHTYNEEIADEIYLKIIHAYYPELVAFKNTMETKRSGTQTELF
jgi:nucleotidyltransferase substrate binding protein (TIGR01987 family)